MGHDEFSIVANENRAYLLLWAAVMRTGIDDAIRESKKDGASRSSRDWLESNKCHIGSFVWLCDLLDVGPDYARKVVRDKAADKRPRHQYESARREQSRRAQKKGSR